MLKLRSSYWTIATVTSGWNVTTGDDTTRLRFHTHARLSQHSVTLQLLTTRLRDTLYPTGSFRRVRWRHLGVNASTAQTHARARAVGVPPHTHTRRTRWHVRALSTALHGARPQPCTRCSDRARASSTIACHVISALPSGVPRKFHTPQCLGLFVVVIMYLCEWKLVHRRSQKNILFYYSL